MTVSTNFRKIPASKRLSITFQWLYNFRYNHLVVAEQLAESRSLMPICRYLLYQWLIQKRDLFMTVSTNSRKIPASKRLSITFQRLYNTRYKHLVVIEQLAESRSLMLNCIYLLFQCLIQKRDLIYDSFYQFQKDSSFKKTFNSIPMVVQYSL